MHGGGWLASPRLAAWPVVQQRLNLASHSTAHSIPCLLLMCRLSLNRLAVGSRRMSLDNSVLLDRRRWALAAAAMAAAAEGTAAPVEPLRSSAPAGGTDPTSTAEAPKPSFQSRQLQEAGRAGSEAWLPSLASIASHSSPSSSRRSSMDDAAPAQQQPQQQQQGPRPSQAPAQPVQQDTQQQPEEQPQERPGPRWPPHILVAEDNLINQRVIRKVLEVGSRPANRQPSQPSRGPPTLMQQLLPTVTVALIPAAPPCPSPAHFASPLPIPPLNDLQRVIPEAPVEIVCNGLEALEAVHRRHFDLVLMDLHMPLLDGLEASRLLNQQLPPERRPVVVAVSADTLQALHEQCREAGIREFICKPFRVEDVQRVLDLVRPPAQQQP